MKKILVIILTVLYVASTSGATIHFHYCMGEMVNASLKSSANAKCGKCGMEKKKSPKSCCNDQYQFVKIEKDHEKGSFDYPLFVCPPILFSYHTLAYRLYDNNILLSLLSSNGPPIYKDCPVFLMNRNLRI